MHLLSHCLMFELYDAALAGTAVPAFSSPNCVHTLLSARVAAYVVGYSLCGGLRLSCWIRLCLARYRMFSMLSRCTHRCVLELRHTAVSAFSVSRLLFGLYCAARVQLCGVMRSCVCSLCGWRALAVVHWKGGGIPVDFLNTAVSAPVLLCC